jgi:hypothetical protein
MTVYLISTIKNFVGLTADEKPTSGMPIGSRYLDVETPAEYIYVGDYYATGVLTIDDVPEATDTILVDATTYTFVASGANEAGEINIGATVAAAVANILAALDGSDGWNTANASVTAEATAADEITLTATDVGSDGEVDSVYTNSGAGTNAFGAATLSGGHDQWQALA